MQRFMIVVLAVLIAVLAVTVPVIAGGGGSKRGLAVNIRGLEGWEDQTSSDVSCQIDPPFYLEGESNVRFEPRPHSENISSLFLVSMQKNQRRTTPIAFSTISRPYTNGELKWTGVIEIGARETRPTIEVRYWDGSWPQLHAWTLSIFDPNGVKMQETTVTHLGGYTETMYVLPAVPRSRYTFVVTATTLQ